MKTVRERLPNGNPKKNHPKTRWCRFFSSQSIYFIRRRSIPVVFSSSLTFISWESRVYSSSWERERHTHILFMTKSQNSQDVTGGKETLEEITRSEIYYVLSSKMDKIGVFPPPFTYTVLLIFELAFNRCCQTVQFSCFLHFLYTNSLYFLRDEASKRILQWPVREGIPFKRKTTTVVSRNEDISRKDHQYSSIFLAIDPCVQIFMRRKLTRKHRSDIYFVLFFETCTASFFSFEVWNNTAGAFNCKKKRRMKRRTRYTEQECKTTWIKKDEKKQEERSRKKTEDLGKKK